MKTVKIAMVAVCALFSATAPASTLKHVSAATAVTRSGVSDCYYQYSYSTVDADYDVYYCYSNGDGSY